MHTLIPHAAPPSAQCQAALGTLRLPHLQRLLQLCTASNTLQGNPQDLTPLHERVLAQQLGLSGDDGLIPWAAWDAHRLSLTQQFGASGWAWVTPCNWTVHTDHVHMDDPQQLALPTHDALSLLHTMQPYFAEDGITLFAQPLGHACTRWLAHGAVFANLPTAALDRVASHTVDPWMPRQHQAKILRRLQNEMQMLLYTHPVNDARATFKLPPVNSFWVSGTGNLPNTPPAVEPDAPLPVTVRDALRKPALQDDATAWAQAWEALDSITLAQELERLQRGEPLTLTLCGPHRAITLQAQNTPWWGKLLQRWRAPTPSQFLAQL
jgi:hypothetical protein